MDGPLVLRLEGGAAAWRQSGLEGGQWVRGAERKREETLQLLSPTDLYEQMAT